MSSSPRQSRGGDLVGRLLRSAWRYKGLIVAAVLLGSAARLWVDGRPADTV